MTSAQFLEFLISVSIQAAFIVGMTSWLCRIVETPHLQCRLWNTCHLLLLLVALTGMVLPHFRAPVPWQLLSPHVVEQVVVTQAIVGRSLLVIWILGTSVSTLSFIREWERAFRFLKSCRVANEQEMELLTSIDPISQHHNSRQIHRPVRLLISRHLGSPFCCQWHHPHLVIPEFLLELPPDQIKLIARHELEHLRSGHPLQLFMERLVMSAFWFHPAVWWASRQSALAREYACDDAAVSQQQETVCYLKALVAVAERGLSEETDGATLFFGRGASIIALRGRRLLDRGESLLPTSHRYQWRGASLLLVVLAVTVWFVWVPLDALASSRSRWSPWPQWSANVLRTFEIPARDFEPYETRTRLHELSIQARHHEQTERGLSD
ncbi:M56 family metallopeptidase [Planctomicrobium sp. SH527]|uniref:M56 family metallopeptidase n=1 Tax=Planctomicrobium sp. SH527 TaxID=3448123 RepID=UPI003F5CA718